MTFAAGAFAAKTFTPTSAAVTVNVPTKTSHLTNDSGFLTSVPSTYATQTWVTSQGYLTSITKSMVTTALGYTPPNHQHYLFTGHVVNAGSSEDRGYRVGIKELRRAA